MEKFRTGVFASFLLLALSSHSAAEDAIYFPSVPDSITFNTVDALHSTEVANIISSMLAYTLVKPPQWQSLGPVNPLKRPEAIFVLNILGISPDLELNIKGMKFQLENLFDLAEQYTLLSLRTMERYGQHPSGKPILLKMDASEELYGPKSDQRILFKSIPAEAEGRLEKAKEDSELGRAIQEGTFNTTNEVDAMFLVDLETIKMLLKALSTNKASVYDGVPDIFWVELRGLHGIVQEYGVESNQAKEAARLFEQVVMEVVTTMQNVYAGRAVVSVISESSLPDSLIRKSRGLLADPSTTMPPPPEKIFNLAYDFDTDFHVAFALITFTSVMLILAVLGVSVAMWFMDPGRDSIIYRMTSQRKKD